jgi:hypothetical protein
MIEVHFVYGNVDFGKTISPNTEFYLFHGMALSKVENASAISNKVSARRVKD